MICFDSICICIYCTGINIQFIQNTNKLSDKFQNKYRIPSARASWWDYNKNGAYFVTICTAHRVKYFGETTTESTENLKEAGHALSLSLSETGKMAHKFWLEIPSHFPFVGLDQFVIMPNHVHGIIIINKPDDIHIDNSVNTVNTVETGHALSLPHYRFRNQGKNTVSAIVGSFKSATTRWCNENGYEFGWQTRFHDRIIRTDAELDRIREYIVNNPANWLKDKFNNHLQ